MLTVADCFTRESLAIHVGQSLKGEDFVRVVDAIACQRGTPQTIKVDNGSEFISKAMDSARSRNKSRSDSASTLINCAMSLPCPDERSNAMPFNEMKLTPHACRSSSESTRYCVLRPQRVTSLTGITSIWRCLASSGTFVRSTRSLVEVLAPETTSVKVSTTFIIGTVGKLRQRDHLAIGALAVGADTAIDRSAKCVH